MNIKLASINHIILGFLILLLSYLLILTTRWGIGTSPDSATYIGVANNLLSGKGLTVPFGNSPGQILTFYPPLYPLFLAGSGLFGGAIPQTSRWLHMILLASNLFVFWLILRQLSPRPGWVTTFLLFPLAFSNSILTIHIMAWSEALFLLTGFAGLLLISQGIAHSKNNSIQAGSILLGFATLSRYSGLAFIASAAVGIFILMPGKFSVRLKGSLRVAMPALFLFSGWIVRNLMLSGNIANRGFEFHPITRAHFQQGLDTIAGWFLIPVSLPGMVKIGLIGAIALTGWLILQLRHRTFRNESQLLKGLLSTFVLIYPLFLFVSISLFDANTPLDDRILSPLLVAFWILIASSISQITPISITGKSIYAIFVLLLATAFSISSLGSQAIVLYEGYQNGLGFSHNRWRNSAVINQINNLQTDTIVYTNSPEGVYLLTGRPAKPLPRKTDLTRQIINPEFEINMKNLQQEIFEEKAVIAYFYSIRSITTPDVDELNEFITNEISRHSFPDGILIGK